MNQTKLNSIINKINRRAAKITSPSMTYDDIKSIMVLSVLERSASDSNLENQTEAYIVQGAEWAAKNQARADLVYLKYVEDETTSFDPDDNEEISIFELTPESDHERPVEETVMEYETAISICEAVENLSIENKTVFSMIYLGYTETEIAKSLNITKQAISQRKATIAKAIKKYQYQTEIIE